MNKLEKVIAETVASAGYDLWHVQWSSSRGQKVLKVLIEKTDGIKIADCVSVSKLLGPRLEVEELIKHAYRLEVSSPGLERPLVTLEHFKKFIGDKAKIKLKKKHENGKKKFTGEITEVNNKGQILIKIRRDEFWIGIDDIRKANLVYNFKN